MTDLASRIEAAEGPSRELDLEIVALVKAGMRHPWFVAPPPFTSSLDAAMQLVPEGLRWFVSNLGREGAAEASVTLANGGWLITNAATPALALCSAALHARQQGASKHAE